MPVYVDEQGSSVYSVFVTSSGLPDIYTPCDGCQSYRYYESAINMGYCVATTEQVNALEIYILRNNLRDLDMMAYPDGMTRPPAMQNILQNGHRYDVGTVMITPDFARFYIRRSGGCTVRLVHFSITPLTRPATFRHS